METKTYTKNEVKEKIMQAHPDVFRYSANENVWVFKHGYFYRFGQTATRIAEGIKHIFPEAIIVRAYDDWKAWPKNSYFVVEFQVPMKEQKERVS